MYCRALSSSVYTISGIGYVTISNAKINKGITFRRGVCPKMKKNPNAINKKPIVLNTAFTYPPAPPEPNNVSMATNIIPALMRSTFGSEPKTIGSIKAIIAAIAIVIIAFV